VAAATAAAGGAAIMVPVPRRPTLAARPPSTWHPVAPHIAPHLPPLASPGQRIAMAIDPAPPPPLTPSLTPSMPTPAAAPARLALNIDYTSPHLAHFGNRASPSVDTDSTAELPPGTERRARSRDPVFEKSTESGSRSIAARFAPSSTATGAAKAVQPARKPGLLNSLSFRRGNTAHKRPSLNLLMRPATTKTNPDATTAALRTMAGRLEHCLSDFGVDARVLDFRPGPVVSEFLVELTAGTKLTRIVALADDIARVIGVPAVRISAETNSPANQPGGHQGGHQGNLAAIRIDVPNMRPESVLLRDILDSEVYRNTEEGLPLAIGKSTAGSAILIDLATLPHLLVVGAPNTGKSVGLNVMILSLLFRHAPEDCRLLLIDTSMVDFGPYSGMPHLLAPVISEPARGVAALLWAVTEMDERYKRMAHLGLQDVGLYNNRVRDAKRRGELLSRTVQTGFDSRSGLPIFEENPLDMEVLPSIVILVDEFADLMLSNRRDTEQAALRLSQHARAAGIHLVMATQRPSSDVITPALREALPARMIFKLNSKAESRVVLGETGAEQLLGHGDMLLISEPAGSSQMTTLRVHGALVSPEEIESVAASVRAQGTPRYVDGLGEPPAAAVASSDPVSWQPAGGPAP
jgi:DNA segregation ATPase FtsK/SpoIIIE, S-DNA-T family